MNMKKIPDLLMRYQARQHWGKCSFQPLDKLHQLYPYWKEFTACRNELDPNGLFINDFAKQLGITHSALQEDS